MESVQKLDCKDLHCYVLTLPASVLDQLYSHPATCLAIFRSVMSRDCDPQSRDHGHFSIRCRETSHRAHRTASRRARRVTGLFAPSLVRPIGRIQRFVLIQLKPKHHRLVVFNYSCHSVRMSCWIEKLLTYLQGAKRPGGELTFL